MSKDYLIAALKGAAWALMVLVLLHMCASCKSSKQVEQHLVTEQVTKKVSKSADSITAATIAHAVAQILINARATHYTERTHYSTPDSNGRQHITLMERTHTAAAITHRQNTDNMAATATMVTRTTTDSVQHTATSTQASRATAEATPAAPLPWAPIIAIVAVIVGAWIFATFFFKRFS